MRQHLARQSLIVLLALAVSAPAPTVATPADTCAAATFELGLLPFSDIDTTVARDDTNTYAGPCADASTGTPGSSAVGADLYYRIRPSASCTLQVSMNPTGSENLGLYIASDCAPLSVANCITMDDNGAGGTTEVVQFAATAGTDYYILVDGNSSAEGTFSMAISSASGNCGSLVGEPAGPSAPTITNGPPPDGIVGVAYLFAFTSTGSPAFSVTSGALPLGLTMSSSGVIDGTPTTEGEFTGTVTATNGTAPDATQDFSIQISGTVGESIPTLDQLGLIVLAMSLLLMAWRKMR